MVHGPAASTPLPSPLSPRREEERGLQRGQASVEPIMKRTESDDSLVDYGDVEIQFNEDGSFIGEYAGHKDKRVSTEIKGPAQAPA